MVTCRDIVARALRMVGVLPPGGEAEADEYRDGLEELQALYSGWFTGGMFGALKDHQWADGYWDETGVRIVADSLSEVELPTTIDGYRVPYDLSAIEINAGGEMARYVYDRAGWVRIDGLTDTTIAPLAHRGEQGLAACLAVALSESYGAELGPVTIRKARAFKEVLSFNAGADMRPREGLYA